MKPITELRAIAEKPSGDDDALELGEPDKVPGWVHGEVSVVGNGETYLQPPAKRLFHSGHWYVPAAEVGRLKAEVADLCKTCDEWQEEYTKLSQSKQTQVAEAVKAANPPAPTQDDELDARAYVGLPPKSEDRIESLFEEAQSRIDAFLAGRKGMYSEEGLISEVEAGMKREREAQLQLRRHYVAAAVKTERERIVGLISEKQSWYAEDIFSPLTAADKDTVSRDRVSAHMARHICKLIIEDILTPKEGEAE